MATPSQHQDSDGIPGPVIDDAPSRAIAVQLPRGAVPVRALAAALACGCEVTSCATAARRSRRCSRRSPPPSTRSTSRPTSSPPTPRASGSSTPARARAGRREGADPVRRGRLVRARRCVARTSCATPGLEVIDFNPIAPWRRRLRTSSHRDHRKILVVDDAVAFTGGLNIADDYAALADGGGGLARHALPGHAARSSSIWRGCSAGPGSRRAACSTRRRGAASDAPSGAGASFVRADRQHPAPLPRRVPAHVPPRDPRGARVGADRERVLLARARRAARARARGPARRRRSA